MSRFRDEATRNSKIIIDEYHKTEVTQSFPSDLNLSGSSHVYRVGTDPTTRFNGKGHMNKHNGLCRSRSSVAAIGSSKSFADAYHGSEYRLYGKKIREDKGITFSIIPPTQGRACARDTMFL